jgi:hypothetical protein
MIWQTPALGLTAQAFLLTIALSADASRTARLITAILSLVTALVAMQTMTKHRYNETTDARLLECIERELGFTVGNQPPHMPPRIRGAAVNNATGPINKLRSFDLWMISLSAFALSGLIVIIVTIVQPSALLR